MNLVLGNRYEVLRELGRGGMGVVYLARDPLLDREVAIKVIPTGVLDAQLHERFRREARAVARLDHPGVVGIHDFGSDDGSLFYVMPLVRGQNLRELAATETLALGEIIDVSRQVAKALEYSHAGGIIHRDIKPENVMVTREGDGKLRARVTDFGLAMIARERRLTDTGMVVGTLAYLAGRFALVRRAIRVGCPGDSRWSPDDSRWLPRRFALIPRRLALPPLGDSCCSPAGSPEKTRTTRVPTRNAARTGSSDC